MSRSPTTSRSATGYRVAVVHTSPPRDLKRYSGSTAVPCANPEAIAYAVDEGDHGGAPSEQGPGQQQSERFVGSQRLDLGHGRRLRPGPVGAVTGPSPRVYGPVLIEARSGSRSFSARHCKWISCRASGPGPPASPRPCRPAHRPARTTTCHRFSWHGAGGHGGRCGRPRRRLTSWTG
jgi:hypothetical protein